VNRPAVVTALALAGLLSACAVGVDETPRDIDQGTIVLRNGSDAAQAGGAGRIYLTVPGVTGEPTRLRSVARDVPDDPDAVVAALLAGPNTDEFADQLRSAVPDGLQVLSLQRRPGGVLELDVTDEIQQLSGDAQVLALAQIVYTMSDLDGVTSVRISVNGQSVQWPDGSGELSVGPLTVYDFPGLEPTAQPAFPAVPSNEPATDPATTDPATSDPDSSVPDTSDG
jgi:spore germination protein GerM